MKRGWQDWAFEIAYRTLIAVLVLAVLFAVAAAIFGGMEGCTTRWYGKVSITECDR